MWMYYTALAHCSLTDGLLAYFPFGTSSDKSARVVGHRLLCGHNS